MIHIPDPGVNAGREARSSAHEAMREIGELCKDVNRLLLINEALRQIVREGLAFTGAEFAQNGPFSGERQIFHSAEEPFF